MQFILPVFFLIGLMAILLWLVVFRWQWHHHETVRKARQRMEEFDRLLATPGEMLRCLSCDREFSGPLQMEEGCPECHMTSFVVPAQTIPGAKPARYRATPTQEMVLDEIQKASIEAVLPPVASATNTEQAPPVVQVGRRKRP